MNPFYVVRQAADTAVLAAVVTTGLVIGVALTIPVVERVVCTVVEWLL